MGFFRAQGKKEHAVAYCHNPKHRGFLTIKNLKLHKCLSKQCRYLHKYEDRQFWIDRAAKKADKKARKKDGRD